MENSRRPRTEAEIVTCNTCGLSFDDELQFENHVCDAKDIRLNVPLGFGSRDPEHLRNLIASDFGFVVPPRKKHRTSMASHEQQLQMVEEYQELSKQQSSANDLSFVCDEVPNNPSVSEQQHSDDPTKILQLRRELSQYLNQSGTIVEPYISAHLGREPFPAIPALFFCHIGKLPATFEDYHLSSMSRALTGTHTAISK
jgi:hypothetical protein